jgi:ABC-type transport system involved in multi-copper enzyme maturation permease subunit
MMVRLLRADLLRMRRYWLTWALLTVLILIPFLQIKGKFNQLSDLESLIAQAIDKPDFEEHESMLLEANRLMAEQLRQDLMYPAIIGTFVRTSTGVGWYLVILFTAVMGGEDFTRRTLQNFLSRGIGRVKYTTARCLSLWIAGGMGIFILVVLAAIIGLFTHDQVTTDPISLKRVGNTVLMVIRTWLTFLPFIIATLFWAVLARNPGPAMAVGIGLHTLEFLNGFVIPFIAVVFGNLSGSEIPWFYQIQVRIFSISLGYNADVFLNWGAPFSKDPLFVAKTLGLSDASLLPSTPLRSGIILIIFVALFPVWIIGILQRRDVSYGS